VWQFLAPGLALALAIGIFAIAAYNPLAAALAARYAELEAKLLRGRVSLLAVSPSGLWLRDADSEGQVVIHALRVMRDGVELDDAIFLYYSGADRFARRIDAATARLGNGQWELEDALVTGPDRGAEIHARLTLPTTLTLARIQDSFVPPETMSFWALPAFIETLEKAGFSALRHRLHFLSTLAIPFLLCAMVLVAATVSLRLTRRGGVGWMLAAGVLAGFLFYFLSDLTLALGMAGSIPAHLAAFSPTAVTALLGIALLFHLEDG
jgi:lipopolysaccharide export system permease protein